MKIVVVRADKPGELVLRLSSKKWVLMMLIGGGCYALCIAFMPRDPHLEWFAFGAFGLPALIAPVLLLSRRRIYLRLTPVGYEERWIFRIARHRWADIDRFVERGVWPAGQVGVIFAPSYTRQAVLRRVVRALGGQTRPCPTPTADRLATWPT